MNKAELLSKYEINLAGSKNKNHYLSYARDFLDYAEQLDRENVDHYIAKLKKKKRRPGTLNFVFRVIKRLFTVNDIPWPYLRGQAPQISERDEDRPALSLDLIKRMIEAARTGKLDTTETCFLALSTIYGLRREEMMDIEEKDIDLKSNTIFISTIKQGRQRYHLIPGEIKEHISNHDFSDKFSPTGMSQVFWRIVNKSGLDALQSERLGWHSIRRAVLSGLIDNGLNLFAAKAFLRWKTTTGEMAMPARYYSNVTIGLQGRTVISEEAKGDREIFEKYHPLLKFWT
jgi:integrase